MKRLFTISILTILFIIASSMSFGQEVITDKPDYYPGDTVKITGTGWLPGETVRLVIDY